MPEPSPRAAGLPLALALIAGALIGGALGQPTIGLLIGAVVGTAIAIATWLLDRRRLGR